MPWVLMFGAIASEIVATLSLRGSHGLTRPGPTIVVLVGYLLSFWLLSRALQSLSVGLVYAIWSGVGTAAVVIAGYYLFGDRLNRVGIGGVVVVVVGVAILCASGSGAHGGG